MKRYSKTHLSDQVLLRDLIAATRQECCATAELLALIAEYDARRLYRPAGYDSMFTCCVHMLHLSEVAAYKRIRAARAAHRFPTVLDAVAEGRLHLTAVVLLAPHLTEHTATELLSAATHKTRVEIERLLAERFPRPDMPTRVQAIPAPRVELTPGPVPLSQSPGAELTSGSVDGFAIHPTELASGSVGGSSMHASELTSGSVPGPVAEEPRPIVKPLAPQRFALQCTIDQETHDALCYAQELLSHQLPSGDVATVLRMALQVLIPELEKRRFSATVRPRRRPGWAPRSPRCVPSEVQRAVWKRDQGRCTFVSESGHRCEARKFVQLDHVQEIARGGESTVDNLRLRCSAHNQLAAERTFGAEFMRHKRTAAAEARASGA